MKKISALAALALACVFSSFSASAQTQSPNIQLQIPYYSQQNWQVPLIYDLTRFDNIFGGTVAVPSIQLSGAITNPAQAATKAYVDGAVNGLLPLAGGTLSGPLVLNADPTAPLGAATKEYVDNHAGSGGSTVYPNPGIPVSNGSAWGTSIQAPQGNIVGDTDIQTLTGKTIDGVSPIVMSYLPNITSDVQGQINALAPLASPAFTGTPTVPTAALTVNNLQAASTNFVQSLIAQATANLLSTSGGSLIQGATITLGDGSPAASQAYVATAISGLSGSSGTTTTTNQLLTQKTTSAAAPGKICAAQANISGSVYCGGVQGTPVSITTQYGLSSPTLNNVGVTGKTSQLGLTVNSSANTQVLWPTTIGSYDQATSFKREMWFEGGSNLPGLSNYEVDTYLNDKSDQLVFMFGWQCNRYNTGYWQTDNVKGGWQNTPVACNIVAGHIYHTILTMHRDPSNSTACTQPAITVTQNGNSVSYPSTPVPCNHYDTFELDDLTAGTSNLYTLNITRNAETAAMTSETTWDGVGSQVQLDVVDSSASSSNQQLVSMYVDDDTLSVSQTVTASSSGTQSVSETTGNLGEYDFDSATPTAGLTITGSPTMDNTNAYTSPNAALFNSDAEYFTGTLSSSASTLYARAMVDVTTAPSGYSTQFLSLNNASGGQLFNLYFAAGSGYISAYNVPGTAGSTCQTAALTAGYHRVEVKWVAGASTGSYSVSIDGTQTCSVTSVNTGTAPVSKVSFGELGSPSSPYVFDMDNVGFSSTGALGGVTVTSTGSGSTPAYDLYGSAAAVAQSSLQDSNNLSDLTNPSAAIANLIANPGAGTYLVTCTTATSCSAQQTLAGVGTPIGSASTIMPVSLTTHVTGTNAISTIVSPFSGFTGCLNLITDGASSVTTGGNIANAASFTAGTLHRACYDGSSWYVQ